MKLVKLLGGSVEVEIINRQDGIVRIVDIGPLVPKDSGLKKDQIVFAVGKAGYSEKTGFAFVNYLDIGAEVEYKVK